jgi:hypothetical protein
MHPSSGVRFARTLLLAPAALALGGCFLVSWLPGRHDAKTSVSGPAPYVEQCQSCHPAPAGYAQSLHSAKGIRCGQCHWPAGHPDYTQPVEDATCGGCHQPQFQQVLATKHFTTRELRPLDHDRAARRLLRQEHFTAPSPGLRRFVGDSSSDALGGRLCAACHYDEHRLGLAAVRQPNFCAECHGVPPHGPMGSGCMECHVRIGTTARGQVVNTHLLRTSASGR